MECPGWKTVVRRVILSETDKTQALLPRMNKGDGTVVLGSGPSLQELVDRIQKLKAALAKPQGKWIADRGQRGLDSSRSLRVARSA